MKYDARRPKRHNASQGISSRATLLPKRARGERYLNQAFLPLPSPARCLDRCRGGFPFDRMPSGVGSLGSIAAGGLAANRVGSGSRASAVGSGSGHRPTGAPTALCSDKRAAACCGLPGPIPTPHVVYHALFTHPHPQQEQPRLFPTSFGALSGAASGLDTWFVGARSPGAGPFVGILDRGAGCRQRGGLESIDLRVTWWRFGFWSQG